MCEVREIAGESLIWIREAILLLSLGVYYFIYFVIIQNL
jgi:hypothetical protein